MNKLNMLIIFGCVFILVIVTCMYVFVQTMIPRGNSSSDNIKDSREIGVYEGTYEINSIPSNVKDTLDKYNLILDSVQVWIENCWSWKTKYVFFHTVQRSNKHQIICNNLTKKRCCNCLRELEFSYDEIKKSDYFNHSVSKSEYIIDSIPHKLMMNLYIRPSDTISYIGKIEFQLK